MMTHPRAARIVDVQTTTEDFRYRTPIKFGGTTLDRVSLLNVEVTIEVNGKQNRGFGSMPLGNVWAWPSRRLTYEATLNAMRNLAEQFAHSWPQQPLVGHPIEIMSASEPLIHTMAGQIVLDGEAMPTLAALVAVAPFDAALHDAYGKAFGLNAYQTYGTEFLPGDVSRFLGPEFAGIMLSEALRPTPRTSLPLYHLVGALDPLSDHDLVHPVNDGLPETLAAWIRQESLTHLKIKLNGDDLTWDLTRTIQVHAVAAATAPAQNFRYSLDFNERCPNVEYLLEFLSKLHEQAPQVYEQIQYIEQPTDRYLKAKPTEHLHAASHLKPIVMDEALLDLETMQLARGRGYTGVAFKACKGQTQTLLLAVAAKRYGLFRCVQDLTCPGASLVHSAGLAANLDGIHAIEANARQYCPAANEPWRARFPLFFSIRDGHLHTEELSGPGLGAVP